MSNSKHLILSRSPSTWSVVSYSDIVVRFQQEVEAAEEKDCYEDALGICLKSMRSLESVDINRLTDEQKLELRYHHGQALIRSQFLFDSMMLKNVRFTEKLSMSIPTSSTSPTSRPMLLGSQSTSQALLPRPNETAEVLSYATAQDETDEEEEDSKIYSAPTAMKLDEAPITKHEVPRTRMTKEDIKLRENIMETVVQRRPTLRLSDVIGLENAKDALQDAVVVPMAFPNSTQAKKAWTGILLYGVRN